jgi:hypothetical protein
MALDPVGGVIAGCLAGVLVLAGAGKLFLSEPTSRLLAALVPGVISLRLARVGVWILAAAIFFSFSGISSWAQNRHVHCGRLGFLTHHQDDVIREAFPPMLNAGLAVSAAGASAPAGIAYTTPNSAALVVGGLIGAGLVCWRALAARTLARSGRSLKVATSARSPANADVRLQDADLLK